QQTSGIDDEVSVFHRLSMVKLRWATAGAAKTLPAARRAPNAVREQGITIFPRRSSPSVCRSPPPVEATVPHYQRFMRTIMIAAALFLMLGKEGKAVPSFVTGNLLFDWCSAPEGTGKHGGCRAYMAHIY